MTVIQAAFIGVGSMVGAGIFALLGAAGAVAGSAVWVSFLVAGAKLFVLITTLFATLGTFVVFCTTTLVNEPATATALVVILALAVAVDLLWKRTRMAGNSTATP